MQLASSKKSVCCVLHKRKSAPPPSLQARKCLCKFRNLLAATCMYQLRETLYEFPLIHPLSKVIHSEKLTQVFLIPLLSRKVRGDGTLSFPGGMLVWYIRLVSEHPFRKGGLLDCWQLLEETNDIFMLKY